MLVKNQISSKLMNQIEDDNFMVKLNILKILEKKSKTKFWLYNQLGMSYQNFNKMINNQTSGIRFSTIEDLCVILECTPNDLFIITMD